MDVLRNYQKNKDIKNVCKYFKTNKNSLDKNKINIICITIINYLDNNYNICNDIIKEISKDLIKTIQEKYTDESSFNLGIRLAVLLYNKDLILELLFNMEKHTLKIKSRTTEPLMNYGVKQKDIEFVNYIYDLSTKYKLILSEYCYINLLTFYGETENIRYFDMVFNNVKKQLNVISLELSNLIMYYYSFRVINSKIINNCCSHCSTSLLESKLSDVERLQILDKFVIKITNNNPKFIKFINEINKNPERFNVDYILDGANIGYFQQRPDKGGRLSFNNIQRIMSHLDNLNKTYIIFLHEKHLNKSKLSINENKLLEQWEKNDIIYKTLRGLNDDWYWIYLGIYVSNSFIISNDKLCDHYFQCEHSKSFKRWRDLTKLEFEFDFNTKSKVTLILNKLHINGTLESRQKIHIPYYKTKSQNKDKIEWLCIDK
jgi:hypothetical protein